MNLFAIFEDIITLKIVIIHCCLVLYESKVITIIRVKVIKIRLENYVVSENVFIA